MLLRKKGGYEYVVLHLFCQGVEITLKALLLFRDYDNYNSNLKKKYGHDLELVTKEVLDCFILKKLEVGSASELKALNELYKNHLLRYASLHDVLVDPKTIPHELLLKKVIAGIRLADRHLSV